MIRSAARMVFTTLGCDSSEAEEDLVPVLFTQAEPTKFLAFLAEHWGIRIGQGLFCATPEGEVES